MPIPSTIIFYDGDKDNWIEVYQGDTQLNRGKVPFVEVSKTLSNNKDHSGNYIPAYHYKDHMDERIVARDNLQRIAEGILDYTFIDYIYRKFVDIERKRVREPQWVRPEIAANAVKIYKDSLQVHLLNTYKIKYNEHKLSQVPSPIAPTASIPLEKIVNSWNQAVKSRKK
jgi:hypothetical protein